MRTLYLFFITLFFPILASATHQHSPADRITHIATETMRSAARTKNKQEKCALLKVSSTCAQASYLLQKNGSEEDAAKKLFPLLLLRRPGTPDPVSLPLEEIIALLEKEHACISLNLTPQQLTIKRIIFRTITETCYSFGCRAIRDNKATDSRLTLTDQPLSRLGSYLLHEAWDSRTFHLFRIGRMLSNEFIETIVPNPRIKTWQEWAELVIPLILSKSITFLVAGKKTETFESLFQEFISDLSMQLIWAQLFAKKKNAIYYTTMLATYFLAFYSSEAGDQIWHNMKTKKDEGFFEKRGRFIQEMFGNKSAAISVAVDGLACMFFYQAIDKIVNKIQIPAWLMATPITPKKECHEHS